MTLPRCITEYRSLAPYTSIGIGGLARYFAAAKTREDLHQAAAFARDRQLPLLVLGRGSNMLVQNEDTQAVVVKLSGFFQKLEFDTTSRTVVAGAGLPLIKLGTALARRGFAGCAFMGVIPGSIGGAVCMNAGTGPGQEISEHLVRALVFDPETLDEHWTAPEQLRFSYRSSGLSEHRAILTEAQFRLPEPEQQSGSAHAAIKELFARRRATQPKSRFTFGSVFRNPAGAAHSAGWYLEQAGMKGLRCGDALVAREHANWIINTGGAAAAEVKTLIAAGQKRVAEQFGIKLQREVVYFPEDLK